MATAAATGNGRISRLPSLTPGSRGRRRGLGGPRVRRWKPGEHALFHRELRPGQTHFTREPSRAVDRQTHEDHSLNRRQEPGHATSSRRLALSSRYCGSPGFGRLCRYPARIGSGPNHGATALDLPKHLRARVAISFREMARSEAERICIDFPMATRRDLALAVPRTVASVADGRSAVAAALVAAAGDTGARRFLEFFAVTIENPNTRAAYFHACRRLLRLVRSARRHR